MSNAILGLKTDSRRMLVANMILQGVSTPRKVRAQLITKHGMKAALKDVQEDFTEIKLEWKQSRVRDFDAALAKELAKIEQLEFVAWDEWHRSRGEHTETLARDGGQGRGFVQTKEAKSLGNPKYLEQIRWCIDKRCKLLGLESVATQKSSITIKSADASGLSNQEIMDQLNSVLVGNVIPMHGAD